MARTPNQNRRSSEAADSNGARDEVWPARAHSRSKVWLYAVLLLLAWGTIFGAVFWSRFLSDLPDVAQLLIKGASRDITILDDQGRLIARRGLTRGESVEVSRLPAYVPNGRGKL